MPKPRVGLLKHLAPMLVADHRYQELKPRQLESLDSTRYPVVSFFKAGVAKEKIACFRMLLRRRRQDIVNIDLAALNVEDRPQQNETSAVTANLEVCIALDFSKALAMQETHVDGCIRPPRKSRQRAHNQRPNRPVQQRLKHLPRWLWLAFSWIVTLIKGMIITKSLVFVPRYMLP
jgi:hypothetical protein